MIVASVYALAHDHRNMLRIHRRQLRDATNPFLVPEARFVELFRFNKEAAIALLQQISPFMKEGVRSTFIPKSLRMLVVLHFYATGSFLRDVGQDFVCPMSKTMICRSVKEVCILFKINWGYIYIRFPKTEEEQIKIQRRFFECTGFPGVIGAIDCTHLKIKKPCLEDESGYINRKGYFFKNVQLICDYDLNILAGYAGFGGSTQDAFIWENCKIRQLLERQYDQDINRCWLVGDSGYPLQPWLMTPFRNPENNAQTKYNTQHIQARNCIERLNGVLKKLFACLSSNRGLLVSPAYSGAIINACMTLHNFRKKHNLPMPDIDVVLPQNINSDDNLEANMSINGNLLQEGRRTRDSIVRNYFT